MEPTGADTTVPYFFLSYAHLPRDGSDETDPDFWVHRLFRDLCEHIRNMTTVPSGSAGFMDRTMRAGQVWSQELADSLTACRVFVPLYSPRYFISPWCGREWTVFGQRPTRYRKQDQRGRPSAVVPALWAPVPEHRMPDCAKEMQYFGPEHTERYRRFGLYGLGKLSSFRSDYQKAVLHLATRIVEVGENVVVERGDPTVLAAADDAFAPGPMVRAVTRRGLRISVAAGSHTRLPEGPSPARYGPTPLEWRPFHPACPHPIGKLASDIAARLEFRPDVMEFDHERAAADGPEVLLLDRWLLRDPEHRARLGEFDTAGREATGLVVPWNETDSDATAEHEVAAEVEATLPERTRRQRQARRPVVIGPDHRALSRHLPRVMQWAAAEYLKRATPRTPPGESPPRFRLRPGGQP
ncbi:TIR-like protein FxsC [Streptomyces hyaluromycini]|uniref:TIR-like protein FxsC n=1 Tax=Streptomyces hyaluromycini TaxID=1377993 RepID=UPI0011AE8EC3|nr:TIR-like protein FxsC [Streptomyces hyaluromycini]